MHCGEGVNFTQARQSLAQMLFMLKVKSNKTTKIHVYRYNVKFGESKVMGTNASLRIQDTEENQECLHELVWVLQSRME